MSWWKFWAAKKEERFDTYLPSEQAIYHYWNGKRMVHADPMVLYVKLEEVRPDLAVDLRLADSELVKPQVSHDAYSKAISRIDKIFNLPEYNDGEDGGLTQVQRMDLFNHFLNYTSTVKKNSQVWQTTSPPMEDLKDTSPTDQPTLSTSDSGSIESKPSTATLEP